MLINGSALNSSAINSSSIAGSYPVNWVAQANSSSNLIKGFAYNGSLWVYVATGGKLKTSPDGGTWTSRTSWFASVAIEDVVYGNGVFVAVGSYSSPSGNAKISRSTDGIFWSPVASNLPTAVLTCVAYANGLFVACTGDTIITSPDGYSWTTRATGLSANINGIAYGNGIWVAGGLATSTDGITWTPRGNQLLGSVVNDITFGGNQFLAIGASGRAATSTDGINWTIRTTGSTKKLESAAYADGKWVVVGETMTTLVSYDKGVTWSSETNALSNNWTYVVAYDDGMFIAGAANGKIATRFYSSAILTPTAGQIGVVGHMFSGAYGQTPTTGLVGVYGGVPTLSPSYKFSAIDDLFEMHGGLAIHLSSVTLATNTQMAYDNDDGTDSKDTCVNEVGGVHASFTKTLSGFVNVDNFGSPSFVDGNLVGIASSIYEDNASGIPELGGSYGAVGFDLLLSPYIDFIQSTVGQSIPYYEVPAYTSAHSLQIKNVSPQYSSTVLNAYPYLSAIDGTLWVYDEQGSGSGNFFRSTDLGETWVHWGFAFAEFSQTSDKFRELNGLHIVEGRWIKAVGADIKTSDDGGSTWTTRFTCSQSFAGRMVVFNGDYVGGWIKQHPVTGTIVCCGAYGRIFYSQNNGTSWTEALLESTPYYDVGLLFLGDWNVYVAYGPWGAYSSNDGTNWIKRTSLGFDVSYPRQYGKLLGTERYGNFSLDYGATWQVIPELYSTNPIDIVYANDLYLAVANYKIYRSRDGQAWDQINATLPYTYNLDQSFSFAAYGNGIWVIVDNWQGCSLVSGDDLNSFVFYNPMGDEPYPSDIYFASWLNLFVVPAMGVVYVTDHPKNGWTKINTVQQDGSFYPYESTSTILDVPGRIILGMSGANNAIIDAQYQGSNYIPNYATKPQPIAASGLIGFFCSAGQASGTVLQTGYHILTVAHAVYGVTDLGSFSFVFNVPAGVTIADPVVTSVTIHPSYSPTVSTSGWFNYDIAIITLAEPVDSRVSRYRLFTDTESLPRIFDKTAYGHYYDPVNGTHDAGYHFITFNNRYEAYGQDLISYGYSYVLDGFHLLYDYDNGLAAQDAIGNGSGFTNQTPDLGLATEGFTAPGRSGSAGLLDGKIAGITWGNISVESFDISPGSQYQGTYGEVGIDLRISTFADWIGVTAVFGLDFDGTLPGLSSSELEFSQPVGLAIESTLSYPIGSIVAAEPDRFAIDLLLQGLSPDIAITVPWQMDATLLGLTPDILLALAPSIAIDSELQTLVSDFAITPTGSFEFQAGLPGLTPDQRLDPAALFVSQAMLSLSGSIGLQQAYDVSLAGILPMLTSEFLVKSDLEVSAFLPSLTSEIELIHREITIETRLSELVGGIALEGHTFAVDADLLTLRGDFRWAHNEMAIETSLPLLIGGMKLNATSDLTFSATLPDLTYQGLWQGIEMADVMPGLRGGMKVIDTNSCTTRYL